MSDELTKLAAQRCADLEEALDDALHALRSARAFISLKQGTTNRFRDEAIARAEQLLAKRTVADGGGA